MKTDLFFLQKAINIASDSIEKECGGPFGALIVKDNEIISFAHNEVTSTNDPTAHAEVLAIRRACEKLGTYQLNDCIVYSSCEPCPMCLGAIYWARPKKVVFALTRNDAAEIDFDDQFIYDEINKEINHRKIEFIQLDLPNAKDVFSNWKNKIDKIEY